MNYKTYQLSLRDWGKVIGLSLGVTSFIAGVFYHSGWAMCLLPAVLLFAAKREVKAKIEARKQKLLAEFMNGMQVLSASLQAGFSMENAWKEVQRELLTMYGETSDFYREVKEMNQSVALNMPIEKLFLEFAYRTELEDIISFGEIFDYGKRNGGNWRKIIDKTIYCISERYETTREIEVLLAAKKLEQQIMNVVPIGILLFLQISSWEYMQILYHNWAGIICMTLCLLIYGLSVFYSEKIMSIQV